jgi:uncharacterized protein (TIGR03083 family)
VEKTPEFPVLLDLVEDRATAFRAAVAAAPALDAQVPTCPEWTLLDLAEHLGTVHRFWAAAVAAGPADAPPERAARAAPREREALLAWSAESTRLLLDALRAAGADRACWTWWAGSQSPQTAGAVARHQVLEAAVHTYDAEGTASRPRKPSEAVALDGVEEFLQTCCSGPDPWPFEPATVEYHVAEGRSWRVELSEAGTAVTRLPEGGAAADGADDGKPDVAARGGAAELLLVLYGRLPIDDLEIEGHRLVLERFRDWESA